MSAVDPSRKVKRRDLVQVALVYAGTGFVLLEGGELLASGLSLPPWIFSVATWTYILGFPVALVVAWAYRFTPWGTRHHGREEEGRRPATRRADTPSTPLRVAPVLKETDAHDGPRVAVLPFVNMSASTEDEYFCDGITDDIITRLSQIGDLRVISRRSAMGFKESAESIDVIAARLGATHVVEGSVRREGKRLRIAAHLLDASDDAHLWASTFDRDVADVFAIQSEVAKRVASALRTRLSPEERRRLSRRPTADPEAHNLFLLARHNWNKATRESFARAEELCEEAIARDPSFARWALAAADQERRAREVLRELHELETTEYVWPPGIAFAYAHLGDSDRAFGYLERCYEDGVGWMAVLHCPPFDVFRGDPRLDEMIERVGVRRPTGSEDPREVPTVGL